MSTKRAARTTGRVPHDAGNRDAERNGELIEGGGLHGGTDKAAVNGSASGWYPDPADPRGLRFWDGSAWTEHRAQLTGPATNAALCSCGVVATGSCRVCSNPFCRAHISEQPREDRAYLRRWEAWTCGGCIELGRRAVRAEQLERCEGVATQLASLGKMRSVRTFTGLRPRKVDLFERVPGVHRPPRAAQAYLIEYDGGEETSTYQGLAISADGVTVYDVGVPMVGTKTAHVGPKRGRSGYHLRRAITIGGLRDAAAAPTEQTWFEYAARAYLRAAKRLMIEPQLAPPPMLAIVQSTSDAADPTAVPEIGDVDDTARPISPSPFSPPDPAAAASARRRSRGAAAH